MALMRSVGTQRLRARRTCFSTRLCCRRLQGALQKRALRPFRGTKAPWHSVHLSSWNTLRLLASLLRRNRSAYSRLRCSARQALHSTERWRAWKAEPQHPHANDGTGLGCLGCNFRSTDRLFRNASQHKRVQNKPLLPENRLLFRSNPSPQPLQIRWRFLAYCCFWSARAHGRHLVDLRRIGVPQLQAVNVDRLS